MTLTTRKNKLNRTFATGVSILTLATMMGAMEPAYAAIVDIANGETKAIPDGDSANYTGDDLTGTGNVADGVGVNEVTVVGNEVGTLTFAGSSTVAVGIGATDHSLGILNAGQDGATVTVTGAAFITTTNVTGTGTIAFGDNLTGTTLALGTGTTTVAGTLTETGVTGTGTLTLTGDATIGTISSTGARLSALNAGANGKTDSITGAAFIDTTTVTGTGTVTLSGNLSGTAIAFASTGTLSVTGAGAQTIAGTIDSANADEGALVITDADDNQAPDTDVFTGKIGNTNNLLSITIGTDTTQAGSAQFDDVVKAKTINIYAGNNNSEDSLGQFDGDVTATTINVKAGNTNISASSTADFNANLDLSGTMTLTGNNVAGGDVLVTIGGDVTGGGGIIVDEEVDFSRAGITIDGAGAQTISATIDGQEAGEGTLTIADANANTAADTDTFSSVVGGTNALGTINIGSSTLAGNASFSGNVSAASLNITGGDHANETGIATFAGNLTTTAIVLDDNTGATTLNITGAAAQTIAGTINAGAAGEGTLTITDATADAAADTDTFSGVIGGTAALGTINVGLSSRASNATFSGNVSTTNLNITGGNHANETGIATFAGNLTTTAIVLDDNTGATTLNISGAGAQTITGTINAAADGEGTLVITDSDGSAAPNADTFSGVIGGSHDLGAINIGSSTLGGAGIFSSAVSAVAITITGGDHADEDSSATFSGNVTASTIALNTNATGGTAALTVNGSADQTIAGTIDGSGDDEGSISVLNGTHTATFSDAVGSAHALAAVNVGSSSTAGIASFADNVAADTTTVTAKSSGTDSTEAHFSGDVTGAIVLDDSSNLSAHALVAFDGISEQTVTGSINGSSAGNGYIEFNNDTTVSGEIGETALSSISIASGAALTLGSSGSTTHFGAETIEVSGTVNAQDTLALTKGSTLTFNDGSQIHVGDISVLGSGEAIINAANASVVVGSSSSDRLTLTLPDTFVNGSFVLFDTTGGTYTQNGDYTIADNGLIRYHVTEDDHIVSVVAGVLSGTELSSELELPISDEQSTAVDSMLQATADDATVTAQILDVLSHHDTPAEKQAVQELIEQSSNTPTAMVASTTLVANTMTTTSTNIGTYLSGTRSENAGGIAMLDTSSGISSGSNMGLAKSAIWARPFYNNISEDGTSTVAGYEANTFGMVMGVDLYNNAETTLGVAFSAANTTVDGHGLSHDRTDVSSYQLTAYGTYNAPSWYVDGQVGYGLTDTDTKRRITFGTLDRIAEGNYSGQQVMVKLDGGTPIQFAHDAFITPLAGAQYTHVANNDYTETGAGVLNLNVSPENMEILQTSLGLRLHTIIRADNGSKFIPQVHVNGLFEALGEEARATSFYTSGGAAFRTTGNHNERLGGNAGGGLTYSLEDMSISAGYDFELRNNYVSHTGTIEARFKF